MTNADIFIRDYNFFSASRGLKSSSKKKLIKYIFMVLAYAILVASVYLYTEYDAKQTHAKILENDKYLSSEDVRSRLAELQFLKDNIGFYKNYSADITSINSQLESTSVIGSGFINTISSAVPGDVSFENMTISKNKLHIQAISSNRQSISEFINNLEELDMFTEVYIANITAQDSRHAFTADCTIKGGTLDEADK